MIDALGRPQRALLLGGTSELGLAIVARLVPEGCRTIVLAGRDGPGLEQAAAGLRERGATVETVPFEVTDVGTHAATVAAAAERAGGLDLVVMAVGVLGDQEADEHDPAVVAERLTANFTGCAAALTAAADHLVAAGAGRLVVLSSVAGMRARRANYVYGSAKAGLDAFAQGLADALVGTGVLVHIVRPGFVVGRMTAGREKAPMATTPAAVAEAVARGLQRGERVIWVPPVLRVVFGLLRLAPAPLWRRMPG